MISVGFIGGLVFLGGFGCFCGFICFVIIFGFFWSENIIEKRDFIVVGFNVSGVMCDVKNIIF